MILNKLIVSRIPLLVFDRTINISAKQIEEIIRKRKMEIECQTRSNPVVTKLNTPVFQSIFNKNFNDLAELFKKYNYEIRIAGGAVRDLLLDIKPKDIDFATTATPVQMKQMFHDEQIRMVNMNGESHGTITPRINDSENFEITTLRVDILTDGRHAKVEYITDWQLDANRRDLTINSMFLGLDGTVYDYFYGYDDLKKQRVAFVGDASQRIQEDYLRILRYFRFYGKIAIESSKHEEKTLNAIKTNINGLSKISGERIWSELKKTLEGNFFCELVVQLINCGAAPHIGLPADATTENFIEICKISEKFKTRLQPIALMCGFLSTTDQVWDLHKRLKLTADQRDLAIFIIQNYAEAKNANIKTFQEKCITSKSNQKVIKIYCLQLIQYVGNMELHAQFAEWEIPEFPVKFRDVESRLASGNSKIVGEVLKLLKECWLNSNFTLNSNDLLNQAPAIYEKLKSEFGIATTNTSTSKRQKKKI